MGPFAILALFPVSGALFLLFLLPSCHMVSCPGHSSSSQQLTGSSSWRVPLPTLLSPNTAAALGTGKVPPRTPSQPLSQAPGSIFGSDRVRNTPRLLTKTASLCSKTDRQGTHRCNVPARRGKGTPQAGPAEPGSTCISAQHHCLDRSHPWESGTPILTPTRCQHRDGNAGSCSVVSFLELHDCTIDQAAAPLVTSGTRLSHPWCLLDGHLGDN